MSNPKTQVDVILEAYEIGQEKLGTKPSGLTHERTELPIAGSGAPVSVGAHPSLAPGQAYASRGCTIFNPQPSDIEVEVAIGKKIYDPKPDPRSKEEIVLNATKQESEIGELKTLILQQQQQINAFIAGQNIGRQNAELIKNNNIPVTETVTNITPAPSTDTWSMTELRAEAKLLGIKAPVGIKKSELIAFIKQVRKAG